LAVVLVAAGLTTTSARMAARLTRGNENSTEEAPGAAALVPRASRVISRP
jgi:hypothetical protein